MKYLSGTVMAITAAFIQINGHQNVAVCLALGALLVLIPGDDKK